VHGNYEAIYDIEANTEKSVQFFKYLASISILLPKGIDKKEIHQAYTQAAGYNSALFHQPAASLFLR
jgi:hypothetical protein